MWTYGSFIVLMLVSFGTLTLALHNDLTLALHNEMLRGDRAALMLAGLIGLFTALTSVYFGLITWHNFF